MARRVREQTKKYSLPDQVKVDTDEKERKYKRKKYREKVQEMGGNVIFADEFDKIDPGLKKGIGLKDGGTSNGIGKLKQTERKSKVGKTIKPKPTPETRIDPKTKRPFIIKSTGSTEGMGDALKIEGKPHSSPEGRFMSKIRSMPLKVVTFKNGGKVKIAKRGGGSAYGKNS